MNKFARITGITLLIIIVLLVILLFSGRWWLLSTNSGSRFVLNQAQNSMGEALQIGNHEGTLSSGLTLRDIKFRNTSTQADIGSTTLEISLAFLPKPELQIKRIYADKINIELIKNETQALSEQVNDKVQLPSLQSPILIQIDDLRLSEITLQLPPTDTPEQTVEVIQLESIIAKLDYHQQLDLHTLSVKHPNLDVNLNGNSELTPPYQHALQLSLQNRQFERLPPQLEGIAVDLTSQGSLEFLNVTLDTKNILPLGLTAELRNVLTQPSWNIQLKDKDNQLQWPPITEPGQQPQASLTALLLTSKGNINDGHITKLQSLVDYPEALQGEWVLDVSGENETIRIENFTGTLLDGQVTANGELTANPATFLTSLVADLNINLNNIQPPLPPESSDSPITNLAGVSGTLRLQAIDSVIKLQPLELQVPNTDWQLSGTAEYGLQSEQIAADIRWQQLSWPPQTNNSENIEFASQSGNLTVNGYLNALQVHLKTDVLGQEIPTSNIDLQATLQDQQLQISPLRLATLEGDIQLNGQFNIDTQIWQANLNANNINPGLHWSEYPGKINLQAKTSGQLETSNQPFNAILQIDNLSGELREQPLSGAGKVRYSDGQLISDGLELNSGQAKLHLQGDIKQLQADISIPDLHDLLPEAQGQFDAILKLKNLDPITKIPATLDVDANARQLHWNDFSLQTLKLNSHFNSSSDEQPQTIKPNNLLGHTKLTINGLELSEQPPLELITLNFEINPLQQQLAFEAQQADKQLSLSLSGHHGQWQDIDDWQQLLTNGWQGQLDTLNITPGKAPVWNLQQPAPIMANTDQQNLDNLCLQSDHQTGKICISLQQHLASTSHAKLQIDQLPLSLLKQYLDIGIDSDQHLSGNAELAWQSTEKTSALILQQLEASFNIDAGQLAFGDSEAASLNIDQTVITASLNTEDKINLNLQTNIEQTNSINTDIQFGPLSSDTPQLSGDLILNMPDLAWLKKPVPELDNIGGSFQLLAQFDGPLHQPLVGLDLDLSNAVINYQPLGLAINAIQLQGKSLPGQPLQAEGQFSAGTGIGRLDLILNPNTKELMLSLQGSDLELLTSPALQLTTSPDITLAITPDSYQINGRIDIPSALIKPPEGAGSQVKESEDVILVGTTQPVDADTQGTASNETTPIPITGELIIALGDAVKVDADVAVTNLTGELILNWKNQLVPIADGEIQLVDGRIQAYGQTLNLNNSRVTYNQTPADNPRLNIRAVRDIFGDPRVVEAGVLVTGNAQEPDIRIFTEPATDEESALAYIATGNDFDHANGQGALNLGVYLFPKLFVSYGIGLFDNGNTANARYEFTDRWNLSLQSGARDTGVDLNWRKDG